MLEGLRAYFFARFIYLFLICVEQILLDARSIYPNLSKLALALEKVYSS